MPKDPGGEKRPAEAEARAVKIAEIATGEVDDDREELASAAAQLGSKGGKARAAKLTKEQRTEIARRAAAKRWKRDDS